MLLGYLVAHESHHRGQILREKGGLTQRVGQGEDGQIERD
jgi:hypothetical protein